RGRALAADGARSTAVLADRQTRGRGRLDRGWASPTGGVWLSMVLDPPLDPDETPLVTLAAAAALAAVVEETTPVDPGIKWPNDLLAADGVRPTTAADAPIDPDRSKIAGILTERTRHRVVVGVGVNLCVDPAAIPPGSAAATDGSVDRVGFVARYLAAVDALLDAGGPSVLLDAWRARADTLGRRVRVTTPGGTVRGTAVDVESPGTLVVETDDGPVRIAAGDCDHLRPEG
ncbi:biotin--[acetyl-CoA-carboxylase] ligase, partial [Halobacteriales archaeon SW_7_68_16]